jgi:Flp pilus assembly protein TadD
MAKPQGTQVALKTKGVVMGPGESEPKGRKTDLVVAIHHLWMGEGRELSMADVDSVRLSDPTTVVVRVHGRPKPYEFHMKSEPEARELRASLVFYAKFTRGGIPGVEDWHLLLSAAYDRLDISDTAVPSGPKSIPGVEQSGRSAAARPPAGATAGRKIIILSAVVLVAVAAVTAVIVVERNRGPRVNLEDYNSLMQFAGEAFTRNDYQTAQAHYKLAVEMNRDSPEANGQAGLCLVKLGQFEEAAVYLARAVRSGLRDHPEYAATLGHCYAKTHQVDKALSVLRQAYTIFPDDPEVNYQLASVLDAKGWTAQARPRAEYVYHNYPEYTNNSLLYAALLVKSGRLADGQAVYLAVARAQPSAEAFLGAALAAGKQADFQTAEQILDEARRFEYQPNDAAIFRHTNRDILAGLGLELPKPPQTPVSAPPPAPETDTTPIIIPTRLPMASDIAPVPVSGSAAEAATDQPAAPATDQPPAAGRAPGPGAPAPMEPASAVPPEE